jgi:2-oxo-4-hydroxy-4-carboxy-5-ureidoimidazoline decarboxylase
MRNDHSGLARFNALSAEDAHDVLAGCLAVPRWIEEVGAGRPFPDQAALTALARAAAEQLTDDELEAALSRHPRIGERRDTDDAGAAYSRAEQAGISPGDELRAANVEYEERFGRVFLIRAAGRSGSQIVAELRRRLGNDDEAERRETVAQLTEIALLRLQQVISR